MLDLVTKQLLETAIQLATPSIEAILACDRFVWGPRWVSVWIETESGVDLYVVIGQETDWNPQWGARGIGFKPVARQKLITSLREKADTLWLITLAPHRLQKNDYLYPGGVYKRGVGIGVSGAKGEADHAIGHIILDMIDLLLWMSLRQHKELGVSQIA